MIKIGVADYGLNVWYGSMYDYRDRLEMLKSLGYDGLERLEVTTHAEAIEWMADARQMGMSFATCRSGRSTETIRFSAALGMDYIWTDPPIKWVEEKKDFPLYYRQVNAQIAAATKYGLKVAMHNHLGSVETPQEIDDFFANCPDAYLLLDVGHLAAAGGDPMYFLEKYFDRLASVHVKDFVYKDKNAASYWDRIRFCELGAGEMGDLNRQFLLRLQEKGYHGWIFVEHDTHLQDPAIDLKISRDYIRSCGL